MGKATKFSSSKPFEPFDLEGITVLGDDEHLRLQTVFLAIARHSDRPQERARWCVPATPLASSVPFEFLASEPGN